MYVLFRNLGSCDVADGEDEAYAAAVAAARGDGARFLSRVEDCATLAGQYQSVVQRRMRDDPFAREMLAHCHVLTGRPKQADRELRRIADRIEPGWSPSLRERIASLRTAIADDHAVQQLLAWREQTLAGMPHRRALAAQDSAL